MPRTMTKIKYLLGLTFLLIVFVSIFTATDKALGISPNNYDMVFPNKNGYVDLKAPKLVSANSRLVIYDDSAKKIFIKDNFSAPIELDVSAEVTDIIDCKNFLFLLNKSSIEIYGYDGVEYTDIFTEILKKNNIDNKYIINFTATDDKIYFVAQNDKLYGVGYTNEFVLNDPELIKQDEALFMSQDLSYRNGGFYFSNNGCVYALTADNIAKTDLTASNFILTSTFIVVCESDKIVFFDYDYNCIKTVGSADLKVSVITDITADKENLYVCDANNEYVKQFAVSDILNNEYTCLEIYGKSGDIDTKLSEPLAAVAYGNRLFILDAKNKCVKILGGDTLDKITFDKTPTAFSVNNGVLYYADTEHLHTVDLATGNGSSIPFNNIDGIESFGNGILLSADGRLYTLDDNKLVSCLPEIENIADFKSQSFSSFVYVLKDNVISKYLGNIKNVSVDLSMLNIGTIIDFDTDCQGNIFVLSKRQNQFLLSFMQNNRTAYALSSSIILKNDNFPLSSPVNIEVSDSIYITDKSENFVIKISDTNFTDNIAAAEYNTVVLPSKAPLEKPMSVYTTTEDCILYTYESNYELAKNVHSGQILWKFNEDNAVYNDKIFVLCGNRLGFIYNDVNMDDTEKTALNYKAKAFSTTRLYQYPLVGENSEVIIVPVGSKMNIVGEVKGFANGFEWYEVEYENRIYYAVKSDLTIDTDEIVTPTDNVKYMITKSNKIGQKVDLFAFADSSSKVLLSLNDGEKVQLLEAEENGFIKVKYGDIIGYIQSNNLIEGGLTSNQLIAVIVSAITLLLAVIIFTYTLIYKRKQKRT